MRTAFGEDYRWRDIATEYDTFTAMGAVPSTDTASENTEARMRPYNRYNGITTVPDPVKATVPETTFPLRAPVFDFRKNSNINGPFLKERREWAEAMRQALENVHFVKKD